MEIELTVSCNKEAWRHPFWTARRCLAGARLFRSSLRPRLRELSIFDSPPTTSFSLHSFLVRPPSPFPSLQCLHFIIMSQHHPPDNRYPPGPGYRSYPRHDDRDGRMYDDRSRSRSRSYSPPNSHPRSTDRRYESPGGISSSPHGNSHILSMELSEAELPS